MQPLTLDGTTHPKGMVELTGSEAGYGAPGLTIRGGGTTVRGLVVNNFQGIGMIVYEGGGNIIEGCLIGTDISSTDQLGNNRSGLAIGSSDNLIGGPTFLARNVISANNEDGIFMTMPAQRNRIEGNFIGTDISGSFRLGNGGRGIKIFRCSESTIGGAAPGARNLISGNGDSGVYIWGFYDETRNHLIQGNLIGTNLQGTIGIYNFGHGVGIRDGLSCTVGGTARLARNVIAGHTSAAGVNVSYEAHDNLIQGNLLGTDLSGTAAIPNSKGISFYGGAYENTAGGAVPGAGNLISGNVREGVSVSGHGNTVLGNRIGVDISGTSALGNGGSGVTVSSSDSVIGGSFPEEGNLIAFSGSYGVRVWVNSTIQNTIRGNRFTGNTSPGIDLNYDGRTLNDQGDPDEGGNRLQNFPEIALSAIDLDGNLWVTYNVDSAPANSGYDIVVEFFVADAVSFAEGNRPIGLDSWTVSDYETGEKTAYVGRAVDLGISIGDPIIATATDFQGNTSEFSDASWIVEFSLFSDGFESGDSTNWSFVVGMTP